MNAALYFELVDAITTVNGSTQLKAVADLIAATPMHPLERRVLERALRTRTEALAMERPLVPDLFPVVTSEPTPLVLRG